MKIEDILAALPSRDDLAAGIGMQARSTPTADIFSTLGIFTSGVILGAGLALLLAPKPGREIRHDIAEKVGEIGGQMGMTSAPNAPLTANRSNP
ncbi:MAG: hypothetical protein SH850_04975 [Planctomycetaceae bacterium]|nr:hypothetical protein [Planctomycetaceae bacterium]